MARIRGYSEEEVDLLIVDFERTIEAAILRTLTATANNLKGAVVASSSAGLSPDDVHIITMQWADEVEGELTPYIGEVYTGSAVSVAISTAEAFPSDDLPGVPLIANENVLTFMKTVTNRLVNVGDELWEDVRNELIDGINTGQSVEQIANRIVAVSQFSKQRATVIARTEVHGAAEAGSLAQISYMGYENDEVTKEWLSAHDLRTRKSHSHADGQTVQLNETFSVGRASLRFPGDPTGPADEIIQCRCSTAYDIQEAPKFRCAGELFAASAPGSTTCITPAPAADISHLDEYTRNIIFNTFMKAGITPAYGGAKIHKILHATRNDLVANYPNIANSIDDMQVLTVVDIKYVAAKDTFGKKFSEWAQAPAGQKALAKDPLKIKPVQAVSAPIKQAGPPVIESITIKSADVEIPAPTLMPQALPPIAPVPGWQDIVFTGKTLGSHGAQVWSNPTTGDRWLFKPQIGFLTDLDIAMAKLQSKAKMTRPAIYKKTLQGKSGSLQFMFKSSDAWPNGSFDPLKLTSAELSILQREQIFDWMISNHDTHSGQWIRLEDGQIYGTDKGQAFKFFGQDKLSWDYVPVTPLGDDKLTYTAMWKKFIQGKDVKLQDPTKGELGAFIKQLQSVSDDEYRALLLPYASAVKQGQVLEKFLNDAVARKNNLEKDFADFWQRAINERSKHAPPPLPATKPTPPPTPPPPPAPPAPPPTPTIVPSGVSADKAYSVPVITFTQKKLIWAAWLKIGGDKKVTPAYGGAKIYKQLQELKTWASTKSDALKDTGVNELQLLNILDEQGGFSGKPKTYEGEVMKWLALPAGKKYTQQNGGVPSALKPSPIPPKPVSIPAPTPSVTPIVSPKAAIPDAATEVLTTGKSVSISDVQIAMQKYKAGEVIAYAKTGDGDIIKLVQTSGNNIEVHVKKVSKGEDTWAYDDDESKSNITGLGDIYDVRDYGWKLKPTDVVLPSKIPGKVPYDVVSTEEVNTYKHLFDKDEIIATGKAFGADWRIVSDGDGATRVEYRTFGETTWTINTQYKKNNDVFLALEYKLTTDVLLNKQVPSLLHGKYAGDKITSANEIWNTGEAGPGDTVAYAYDLHADGYHVLYRLAYKQNGQLTMDTRNIANAPNTWHTTLTFNNKTELDFVVGKQSVSTTKQWYAAKINGQMPDNVKIALGDGSVPGANVKSPITGKNVGESVTPFEIWHAQYSSSIMPGDIIATSNKNAGWHITYGNDGKLHVQMLVDDKWSDMTINGVQAQTQISSYYEWVAGTGNIKTGVKNTAPSATVPKMANAPTGIPQVHVPDKKAGDPVTFAEIKSHQHKYFAGQIIATGKAKKYSSSSSSYSSANYRIISYNGFMVQQKQTAAGSWVQTKYVLNKWDTDFHTDWKLSIAELDKKDLKKLDKWSETHPSPSSGEPSPFKKSAKKSGYSPSSYKPYSPPPKEPFVSANVDVTPWDDTEQKEMHDLFDNMGISIHALPENVWGGIQTIKQQLQVKYGGKYAQLNEIEVLHILDVQRAKKKGINNDHWYEEKITIWLKTPYAKQWINRRIDAPITAHDIPMPMHDFTASTLPPDKQTYEIVTSEQCLAARTASHAKYGSWNPGEKTATKQYTGGVYSQWNAAIRDGNLGSYRESIIKMQRAMRPSTRPMLLHRGCSFAELNDNTIMSYETLLTHVNETYVSRGFTSASYGGHSAFGGQLLIEIECPVGTPMNYVADYSSIKSEREVQLPAHLVYQILSVTKSDHKTKMRVRVIGVAQP